MKNTLSAIIKGYQKLFFRLALFILIGGGVMGAAVLLITPLWYAATHYKEEYTAVMLLLAGAGAGALLMTGLIKSLRSRGGMGPWCREVLLPAAGRCTAAFLGLILLYTIIVMFASGAYLPALLTAGLGLLTGGYYFFRPSRRR